MNNFLVFLIIQVAQVLISAFHMNFEYSKLLNIQNYII